MHIVNELGADVNDVYSFVELFYPNPTVTNPELDPLSAYQSLKLHPAGAFRNLNEFDDKYVLAPLTLVQELFHAKGMLSSIEISTGNDNLAMVKDQLKQLLGNGWKTETRYEQNKTLYMIMGSEKWAIYAILVLVLLIASFNMIGALSMLVMEKQKDIAILKAMGAEGSTIRRVFLLEGMLWSLLGGISGISIAVIICLAQQHFGIIKVGGTSMMIDSYPVEMQLTDIMLVITTILAVGLLASWYPSLRATKAVDPSLKSA